MTFIKRQILGGLPIICVFLGISAQAQADSASMEVDGASVIPTSSSAVQLPHLVWQRIGIELGAFYSSPAALEKGMVSGVSVHSAWPLSSWISLGTQIGVGQAEASNLTYRLEHVELHGLFTAESSLSLGRGQLGVVLGAGVLVLNETRSRHGSMRIAAAGLEPVTSAWTSGPTVRFGPKLRLNIVRSLDILLQTDLTYGFVEANDEYKGRLGWFGLLALGYRL